MGKRREGREAAVQFLYQLDLNREDPTAMKEAFWRLRSGPGIKELPANIQSFTEEIVRGVLAHQEEIDVRIKKFTANYELHRISAVDRNILRLGIFEMLHCPDVPPVVAINECIEIAKRFGTEESGRFVNGVLDSVRKEVGRDPRSGEYQPSRG